MSCRQTWLRRLATTVWLLDLDHDLLNVKENIRFWVQPFLSLSLSISRSARAFAAPSPSLSSSSAEVNKVGGWLSCGDPTPRLAGLRKPNGLFFSPSLHLLLQTQTRH